ncbi:MAG: hypothetical protein AAF657_33120, partial [Acidobacteriota bacterium]
MGDETGAWRVVYSDHSGNAYRFWQGDRSGSAQFEYDPVTPEQSSSGTYSGGEPEKGALDPAQVEALWSWLRDLEGATASHTSKRRMGTGSFRILESGSAERRFILRDG